MSFGDFLRKSWAYVSLPFVAGAVALGIGGCDVPPVNSSAYGPDTTRQDSAGDLGGHDFDLYGLRGPDTVPSDASSDPGPDLPPFDVPLPGPDVAPPPEPDVPPPDPWQELADFCANSYDACRENGFGPEPEPRTHSQCFDFCPDQPIDDIEAMLTDGGSGRDIRVIFPVEVPGVSYEELEHLANRTLAGEGNCHFGITDHLGISAPDGPLVVRYVLVESGGIASFMRPRGINTIVVRATAQWFKDAINNTQLDDLVDEGFCHDAHEYAHSMPVPPSFPNFDYGPEPGIPTSVDEGLATLMESPRGNYLPGMGFDTNVDCVPGGFVASVEGFVENTYFGEGERRHAYWTYACGMLFLEERGVLGRVMQDVARDCASPEGYPGDAVSLEGFTNRYVRPLLGPNELSEYAERMGVEIQ